MQKNKNGQADANGDGDRGGIENSRGSGRSGNSTSNGIKNVTESGSNNGHKNSKSNNSGNRQSGGSTESQAYLNLGPFTQASRDAIRHMSEAHESLKHVSELFAKHTSDIEEISKIQQNSKELEKQCKERDEKIKMQWGVINGLRTMGSEKEQEMTEDMAKIEKEREQLEADKKKFDQQKENAEKRIKILEAEQKNKQDKELGKLKAEQETKFGDLKQRLEKNLKKKEDDNSNRLTELDAAIGALSKELEEKKEKITQQQANLTKEKEKYEDLVIVRNSFKEENKKLEMRLKMMEDEFGPVGQTTDF
jgi:chromosome segregation ATPase